MADAPRAVVLSGYYGYANVGDDALFQALSAALIEAGTERILVPAGPHVERLGDHPAIEPLKRFDWRAIRAAMRDGACLVSGGGGLLQNATSSRSLAYYLGLLEIARRRRRPYAICAQSIGPLHGRLPRLFVRNALRGATAISVRDALSAARLVAMGIPADHVLTTVDPAFGLTVPTPSERRGRPRIGLSLRATAATETVVAAVRDWLPHCPADVELVWIPCHSADEAVHAAVTESGEHRSAADVPATLAAIAQCDLLVAERLHALIFAVRCGVPAVAIDYDPKVRGVAQDCGVPIAGEDRSLSGPALTESVAVVWADRAAHQARLRVLAAAAAERSRADLRTVFGTLAAGESG